MIGIYKITSPIGKVYIGQSIDVDRRMRSYFFKSNKIRQRRLLESFEMYGKENHIFEIVIKCDKSELFEKERFYQDMYDCIGENGLNCILTPTKEKKQKTHKDTSSILSKAMKGMNNPMFGKYGELNPFFGKKHSDETKIKISAKNSGVNHCFYGIKRPEHSEKMKGVNHVNWGKKDPRTTEMNKKRIGLKNPVAKIILDINTGVYYYSATDYCKIHSIDMGTFRYKRKTGKLNNLINA